MNDATTKPAIRYEDAAEFRENLSGWVCKTCKRNYGTAEGAARWCCATDLPCGDCDGRSPNKNVVRCRSCQDRRDAETWAAMKKVDWDGETPLADWRGDRYYFDPDDLSDRIADHLEEGGSLDDFRLVLCEPDRPRHFDMADYLEDYLSPDEDYFPCADINKIVNDWIAEHAPKMYRPTKVGIKPEVIAEIAKGIDCHEDEPA